MRFFKKHKILTGILLVLVLLIGLCVWFVWDKLNKISYDDGKRPVLEETLPSQGYETESPQTDEDEVTEQTEQDEDVVDTDDLEDMEAILSDMEIFQDSDVFNILLLGTDERVAEFSENARADSIMLLSIHKTEKTVKLVSLERGMGVPILEGQYEGSYDWLTHCFRYGGASLMLEEVQYCLRVDVDRYVRVNFNMFTQIVDSLGGVDISLTQQEADALNGNSYTNAKTKNKVVEGVNHLDGYDALQYARLRYIDSDWVRIQRQRNVIQAILHQAKDLNLLELNSLADTILPLIQTNLTKLEILELVTYAPLVLGSDIEQMSLPAEGTYGGMIGLEGRTLYAVDFETNAQILQEFLYGEAP